MIKLKEKYNIQVSEKTLRRRFKDWNFPAKHLNYKDYINKDIPGSYLVIKDVLDEFSPSGDRYCLCQCNSCGKIKKILGKHVLSKSIISCGCLSQSKGEIRIKELLTTASIPFE